MASKILLKKSTTASAVPTTLDVDVGEVAVNTEDKRLFTQDNGGSVVELGTTPSSVAVTGNATVGGTLGVTGNTTLSGTLGVTGATTLGTATVNTKLTVPTPVDNTDAATKLYVDTEITSAVTNVIDSAPGALDTLNELAAALGDDPNFATTVTNSIATKLPKDGSEAMSGNLDLGTNKVVNVVDPTSNQDAATKAYVDTADNLKLNLSGGTMSGNIAMGTNSITGLADPTSAQDAATKIYVDTITGDLESAEDNANDAEKLAINPEDSQFTLSDGTTTGFSALHYAAKASDSATSASDAQTAAEAAQTAAETVYDNFDDRYLGAKALAPALDNDGDPLVAGALYFDTVDGAMYVYDGSAWDLVSPSATDQQVQTILENLAEQDYGFITQSVTNLNDYGALA
jgi:hypothetical protein